VSFATHGASYGKMPQKLLQNNCKDLLIFVLHSQISRGIFRAFGVCSYGRSSFRGRPESLECLNFKPNSYSVPPSGLL
jgi:hypothetical protein